MNEKELLDKIKNACENSAPDDFSKIKNIIGDAKQSSINISAFENINKISENNAGTQKEFFDTDISPQKAKNKISLSVIFAAAVCASVSLILFANLKYPFGKTELSKPSDDPLLIEIVDTSSAHTSAAYTDKTEPYCTVTSAYTETIISDDMPPVTSSYTSMTDVSSENAVSSKTVSENFTETYPTAVTTEVSVSETASSYTTDSAVLETTKPCSVTVTEDELPLTVNTSECSAAITTKKTSVEPTSPDPQPVFTGTTIPAVTKPVTTIPVTKPVFTGTTIPLTQTVSTGTTISGTASAGTASEIDIPAGTRPMSTHPVNVTTTNFCSGNSPDATSYTYTTICGIVVSTCTETPPRPEITTYANESDDTTDISDVCSSFMAGGMVFEKNSPLLISSMDEYNNAKSADGTHFGSSDENSGLTVEDAFGLNDKYFSHYSFIVINDYNRKANNISTNISSIKLKNKTIEISLDVVFPGKVNKTYKSDDCIFIRIPKQYISGYGAQDIIIKENKRYANMI